MCVCVCACVYCSAYIFGIQLNSEPYYVFKSVCACVCACVCMCVMCVCIDKSMDVSDHRNNH